MAEKTSVWFSRLKLNNETSLLAATDAGLIWAGTFNEGMIDLQNWLERTFDHYTLQENSEKLDMYNKQYEEYFQGERMGFDFPIDLKGTEFQVTVWEYLKLIPYGETTTYSEVAKRIGNPKSVRAVGTAIGRNPILFCVPCHRVINKNGKLGGFRGGLELKKHLLDLERRGRQ